MDPSWLLHAEQLKARDLTVEAAQAIGLTKALKGSGSTSRNIPFIKLKALLDSRSDRDILEGLRKVVSVRLLDDDDDSSLEAVQVSGLTRFRR